jgi:hypothetical protein
VLVGFKTAPLLDDKEELGTLHRVLGLVSISIFLVTFVPIPFSLL